MTKEVIKSIGRPALLVMALTAISLAGCRAVQECCTGIFAARAATLSDMTSPPEGPFRSSGSSGDPGEEGGLKNDEKVQEHSGQRPEPSVAAEPPEGARRFAIPPELPGAQAPPLRLPPFDVTRTPQERRSMLKSLFPEVDEMHAEESAVVAAPPLSLAQLQQIALENSPIIQQAAADVEEARGLAVQAGLYPNPTVGYEGDTVLTARSAGYNGIYATQEFVTANKLCLAESAGTMRMRAAEQNLRKARITLASNVRRGYFDVLIAQAQVEFTRAIARLTQDVYEAQIELVTAGQAAPYEPLQLRVFAVQARNSLVQAENALNAAWRTLAANMGVPGMSRHPVQGSVDMPVPDVDYNAALAFLLNNNSSLKANQALISRAMYNLRLQEVTPIPNVQLYTAFQHDDTTPLSDFSFNIQLGLPLPVWNKNQGNISAAHAQLIRANQDLVNTRNELTAALADAFNDYASNRVIAASYRKEILPDQVRVYRGIYDRFRLVGETIDFAQVVVAQQNLAQVISDYLQALRDQWNATVTIAELLQVDDLFAMDALVGQAALSPPPAESPPLPVPAEDPAVPSVPAPAAVPQNDE